MDRYNLLLLSRHPIFAPLRRALRLSRPSFQVWTDASGKGYGAHLGPARRPIALYQYERLQHLKHRSSNVDRTIELRDADIQSHEAAALYLALNHWKPLLRGSKVEAYMDNSSVCDIYANEGQGAEELQEVVDAVKELAEEEDMELNLTWIRREKNMVADGLSKYAEEGDDRYTNGAKKLMQMGKNEEGKKVSTMVKKIMAAESITPN